MELYGRSWFSIHDFHSVSFNLEVIFKILDSNTCPRSSSTRIQMRPVPRTRITNEQLASLAQSTRRQYERNWKEWSQWCQTTGVHRILPPNKERQSLQLFKFAQSLFNRPVNLNVPIPCGVEVQQRCSLEVVRTQQSNSSVDGSPMPTKHTSASRRVQTRASQPE